MEDSREERRKKARAEEQKRRDELDDALAKPRLGSFEAPATGRVVESSAEPPPRAPKQPAD